jgi:hypothetical protein
VVYDPRALDLCIKVAGGEDKVLYGSDYPHNIGDMAGCLARVNARPAAEAARIAGKNAEKLFRALRGGPSETRSRHRFAFPRRDAGGSGLLVV